MKAIAGEMKASELNANFSEVDNKIKDHFSDNMPHTIKDLKSGKTYRYGEQISADGKPQLIYEEVV